MTGPGRPAVPAEQRFWQKINRTESCWLWTDHLNADGYGRILDGERKVMAHRFSWWLAGNDIPEGMQLDHICRVRACVNPSHLRVTHQFENMQNLNGAQIRNGTGARGVTWDPRKRRYRVFVTKHRKTHYGGQFVTVTEAAEAARQLRLSLYTHNDADRKAS